MLSVGAANVHSVPSSNQAWTRPTGRTPHEVVEIPPARCGNGHPLTAGRVIIAGDSNHRTYLCRRCGLMTIRDYDTGLETETQREPG